MLGTSRCLSLVRPPAASSAFSRATACARLRHSGVQAVQCDWTLGRCDRASEGEIRYLPLDTCARVEQK
eukprot:2253135-Alexandrium_andersonii.AAC.1